MKKSFFIVVLFFSILGCGKDSPSSPDKEATETATENTTGQIYTGNVTLETQEEIDAFGKKGYTKVTGSLTIKEVKPGSIKDISKIVDITLIGKDLEIAYNSALDELNGFDKLTSVKGDLRIEYNRSLTELSGFAKLTSIEGNLNIGYNQALTKLDGFDELASVNVFLIQNNRALADLDDFDDLTSVKGGLVIEGLALTKLDGFDNLITVIGNVRIKSNEALTTVNGFTNLISINNKDQIFSHNDAGSLIIESNNALVNLDGFNNLVSVGGGLVIENNDKLPHLDGFSSLTSVGDNKSVYESFIVRDNRSLKDLCGIRSFLKSNGVRETIVTIEDNSYNPSVDDIKAGRCKR